MCIRDRLLQRLHAAADRRIVHVDNVAHSLPAALFLKLIKHLQKGFASYAVLLNQRQHSQKHSYAAIMQNPERQIPNAFFQLVPKACGSKNKHTVHRNKDVYKRQA